MKRNIGNTETVIRLFSGIAFASLALDHALRHQWNNIIPAVAAVLLVTALTGVCPLYALPGIHKHPGKKTIHKPSI